MSNRRKQKMTKYQPLTAVAAPTLLVLLFGCKDSSSEPPKQSAPPVAVQTTLPKHGPITRFVTLPGEIKPYQQATLYAKVPGYLKTITVDKGDHVTEGKLLVEIEVPELIADRSRHQPETKSPPSAI